MDLLPFEPLTQEMKQQIEILNSFKASLSFEPRKFSAPVLSGALVELANCAESRESVQLFYSMYLIFSCYPYLNHSHILRMTLDNIIKNIKPRLSYNDQIELCNEINNISMKISRYRCSDTDFYKLSKDLNLCIVLIRPNSEIIIVKSNCLIFPVTIYFLLRQEPESFKLDLLLRNFDVVHNEIPHIRKIQNLNVRLKILTDKYFSPDKDLSEPELLENDEIEVQNKAENEIVLNLSDKVGKLDESAKPNIPEFFPNINKSIHLKPKIMIDDWTSTKEPSLDISFKNFQVPNQNIFESYPKGPLNLKKYDKKKFGIKDLTPNMQISHAVLLKPLEFKPKIFMVKLPANSLFPELNLIDGDSVGSLLDLARNLNHEEAKETPEERKIFKVKETCLTCINQEFFELNLACGCKMCFECLSNSSVIQTCIKCSFRLCSDDINELNSNFGLYRYY